MYILAQNNNLINIDRVREITIRHAPNSFDLYCLFSEDYSVTLAKYGTYQEAANRIQEIADAIATGRKVFRFCDASGKEPPK